MRTVLFPQMSIGQTDIADIELDLSSRDDIPQILLGLQHIYTTPSLCEAVFSILTERVPKKVGNDSEETVRTDTGRPGMDQWKILVLGTLRLGLNADYDRIQELANQHRTIRAMLGHGVLDEDPTYSLQTLRRLAKISTSCLSFTPSSALQKGLHTMSMRPFLRLEDEAKSGAICTTYFC